MAAVIISRLFAMPLGTIAAVIPQASMVLGVELMFIASWSFLGLGA